MHCALPAYAGLISSMGLAFLLSTTYLFTLTASFVFLSVLALAFRAKRRRGYAPFVVGSIAAVIMLVGKFALNWNPALYGGVALLFGASLWNSWPIVSRKGDPSAPTETLYQIGSNESEV